jgi:signal transduction histidine kinase
MLPPPLPADLVEGRSAWPHLDPDVLEHVLARSQGIAAALDEDGAARLSATAVAGAASARLASEGRLSVERGDELVTWAASEGTLPVEEARVQVFLRGLLDAVTNTSSANRSLDAVLGVLAALAPAGVRLEAGGRPLRPPVGPVGVDCAEIPVPGTDAVLVVSPPVGEEARCRAFADEAAGLVSTLLAGGDRGPAEVAKLEAAERRLRRLALDLHDGPAQDVAALAADAALLEADLASPPTPERLAAARELAAEIRERLAALGRDVRDLAEVLEPRAMLREPLRDVLVREAAAFSRRVGVTTTLDIDDDLGVMTASQQIALVRVAQEALTNVREHAQATNVHVSARVTARGVSLVVTDDGRGFDVARAKRRGRLGLAGMDERVRLLGGRLTIDSRPGGPTSVEATIPRWRPAS